MSTLLRAVSQAERMSIGLHGSEGLDENRMPFDADSGAVRNRPVFVGAFVDAFHSFIFVLSFQRLAAVLRQGMVLLSPIVVGEWSIRGPRM